VTVKSPIDAENFILQIQYCYFYSNVRQKYFYLGLRNDIKVGKVKMA
jgi:hypothetical protein